SSDCVADGGARYRAPRVSGLAALQTAPFARGRPGIGRGVGQRDAEIESGVPAPARVVEKRAPDRDLIRLTAPDNVVRLLRIDDHADGTRRDAAFAANGLGERRVMVLGIGNRRIADGDAARGY